MDCLACGLRAGYNRVLVESRTGTELGGLCVECEEGRFGDCLRRGLWTETDGCVLCSRDVYVTMPEWHPVTERTPEGLVVRNDYEVTDGTVGLCDEHLEFLTDSDRREEGAPPTPIGPSE